MEQIQVARPALHEQEDHALGLGGKHRGIRRQRVVVSDSIRGRRLLSQEAILSQQ